MSPHEVGNVGHLRVGLEKLDDPLEEAYGHTDREVMLDVHGLPARLPCSQAVSPSGAPRKSVYPKP